MIIGSTLDIIICLQKVNLILCIKNIFSSFRISYKLRRFAYTFETYNNKCIDFKRNDFVWGFFRDTYEKM